MEKLLHERLRDWAESAKMQDLSVENVIAREITSGKQGNLSCGEQIEMVLGFANEIERNYHPKPVDQYGKPWEIGDDCITAEGEEATIVGYREGGKVFIDLHDEREFARSYASDLKRPDSLEKLRDDMETCNFVGMTRQTEQWVSRLTALIERGARE